MKLNTKEETESRTWKGRIPTYEISKRDRAQGKVLNEDGKGPGGRARPGEATAAVYGARLKEPEALSRKRFRPGIILGNLVNPDIRCRVKKRFKGNDDILVEQITLQVGLCMFHRIKTMQNLDIFLPNQKLFRFCSGDGREKGVLELAVNSSRRRPIFSLNLQCNFKIGHGSSQGVPQNLGEMPFEKGLFRLSAIHPALGYESYQTLFLFRN
ncbi:MAG: hypothetical protein M0Z25_00040 [Nitrospiraceae bacterium]|nr:hypothetical protein [Nitrospiraceae bacterium]